MKGRIKKNKNKNKDEIINLKIILKKNDQKDIIWINT